MKQNFYKRPTNHYFQLHFSFVLYTRHFECAPLFLLGGRLSFSGPSFSPFCKVRTPDSHELQSCAATFHMEMNTWSLAWLVFFLASCTALELIHEPRNSRLSPSLSKNSAAQVVAAGFSQLSASWSWSIQLHPQRVLSIKSLWAHVLASCPILCTLARF